MSIKQAMKQWVSSNNRVSVFHQDEGDIQDLIEDVETEHYEPVCNQFKRGAFLRMLELTEKSADLYREIGAVINDDWTIGKPTVGDYYQVKVERPTEEDYKGTFHTHPFGAAVPTSKDIVEMIMSGDKIMCIGKGGYRQTQVKCYSNQYGNKDWNILENKVNNVNNAMSKFDTEMKQLYPDRKGTNLANFLANNDKLASKIKDELEIEKRRINESASKLVPEKQSCSWERVPHMYIHGGATKYTDKEMESL